MRNMLMGCSVLMALTASTVSGAVAMVDSWRDAFGPAVVTLTAADVRADARAGFAIADADQNGLVDEVEFAAYTLVRAELARFSGLVSIGADDPVRIDMATPAGDVIARTERDRIVEAAARRFHVVSEKGAPMDRVDWFHFHLDRFETTDVDANGTLTGDELSAFAHKIAERTDPTS